MLLSEFLKESEKQLTALYPAVEARNMVLLLCMDRLGIKSYTPVTDPEYVIDTEVLTGLKNDLSRLLKNEPLQYVLGKASFYGRDFNVAPGVLIPRPETELLVDLALQSPFGRVLDLCTGSGCIAWTLALERQESELVAVDISEEALSIARSQGFVSPVSPTFVQADVLSAPSVGGKFDLIVSNPPYILEKEKSEMSPNVVNFEPSLALFVPDNDPLLFYRAVARWCGSLLAPSGRGIVEINEKLGKECAGLFEKSAFSNVEIIPDLSGRDRFVRFFAE